MLLSYVVALDDLEPS